MLGISRSYVSRIEKSSLEKINKYLLGEGWFFANYSI
jgi:DNA-directed RNA polymerase specialized sigma subunit